VRLDGRSALGHARRAEVLFAQGRPDAALDCAEAAVGLDSKCAAAFVVRGIRRWLGDLTGRLRMARRLWVSTRTRRTLTTNAD
jgi:hypothetical protein